MPPGDTHGVSDPSGRSAVTDSQAASAFRTTSWAVVRMAGQTDSVEGAAALESLCRIYWPPLYSYLRRCGNGIEPSRDLIQQFFLTLLLRDSIGRADQARGRFRTFLLTALQNFLIDDWKAARALKRGGGVATLSLDALEADERMALEPVDADTPAQAFDRRWAQVILEAAARRHRAEQSQSGRLELHDRLCSLHSLTEDAPRYLAVAAEMGMPVGTLKSLVSRFRHQYRNHIRAIIAETVSGPEEVEDEIRQLLQVFSR